MAVNYGSKRVVTGAHYGLRDWLVQRATAVLMALFTVILLAQVIFTPGPIGYEAWAGIFAAPWMKFLTFSALVAPACALRCNWRAPIQACQARATTTEKVRNFIHGAAEMPGHAS